MHAVDKNQANGLWNIQILTSKFQAERHKHLHFLPLVKTINLLFLFIIFNLYQNPEISRGGEYLYSDFKIAGPKLI